MAAKLVNIKNTKEYVKQVCVRTRGGKFTRVSEGWMNEVESDFRVLLHRKIHRHPSVGKTLMPEQ